MLEKKKLFSTTGYYNLAVGKNIQNETTDETIRQLNLYIHRFSKVVSKQKQITNI